MEALKRAVLEYADIHADGDGIVATPIPGLGVMRAYAPTGIIHSIYRPVVCLVLQGMKQVTAADDVHDFAAGRSVVVGVDMPMMGRVVRASREEPYVAMAVELDMGVMQEIMGQVAATADPPSSAARHVIVEDTSEAVADCALRLVRLIGRPDAAAVLHGPILKELHYWLLAGPHGAAIRRLALPDGHAQRIARAVALLRSDFARPVSVERLAATAGMSPSSFHQHFKAVTSLSPLRFQKQLRLMEARRLMLSEGLSASRAALRVGYESVSQFTREYGRAFGAPPRQDTRRRRATA
ncbi:MAG TPA: AraC family transcriptional regulator [Longimicrobiaceae bacterium]|nr:AraC family transcriptional regulator [Longimicrobiaceae bacterium]